MLAAALKTRVPAPALVNFLLAPSVAPPNVTVPALIVSVGPATLNFRMPVPKLRSCVPSPAPGKVRLTLAAFTVSPLLLDMVLAEPLVLSTVELALTFRAPVPKAVALLIFNMLPAFRVTPPVKVLFPESVTVTGSTELVPTASLPLVLEVEVQMSPDTLNVPPAAVGPFSVSVELWTSMPVVEVVCAEVRLRVPPEVWEMVNALFR